VRAIRAVGERWAAAGWRADLGIALAAGIGYGVLAMVLFHGRAGNIDEVVTRWQAVQLLDGRLAWPLPAHPEATLVRFTGIGPAGMIGQFPIGTVLAMAPLQALGIHWLTGAVWGALALFAWGRLVRVIEPDATTALAAVLLLAISPFFAGQAATQLGHVPVLALVLFAGLPLARLLRSPEHASRHAGWLGLAIGAAAMVRPLDALAAAIPAALLVLWQLTRRQLPPRVVITGVAGVAAPLALFLGSNAIQTGAPLRLGYEQVWGETHRLGFHAAPYGEPHTPARGWQHVRGYLRDLGQRAWTAPVSALVPVALALLLGATALGILDVWLLWSGGMLLLGYWAYWHDGEWVGPRFVLPLMPLMALWTARLPRLAGRMHRHVGAAVAVLLVANIGWGLVMGAPTWLRRYEDMDRSVAADFDALWRDAPDAHLVLVHDDQRRADAARLRVLGMNGSEARREAERASWCDVGWRVRAREAGDRIPPPTPAAWQTWCRETGSMRSVAGGRDASGAILLGTTATRRVVRDLGARTADLADSITFQRHTMVLVWERAGQRRGAPRLAHFDYDSARTAWAKEAAAFAAARLEVTP
jgi:hypothetical protein